MQNSPMFSSVYGKIEVLWMAVLGENDDHYKRIIALRKAMPDAQLIVWCTRPETAMKLKVFFEQSGLKTILSPIEKPVPISKNVLLYEQASNYNSWIRDAFLFARTESKTVRMLNTHYEDANDERWSQLVTGLKFKNGTKVECVHPADLANLELDIASGDVLIDGNNLLLGKSAPLFEKCIDQFMPGAQKIYCEAVNNEDLYHLDVFLTPTGVVNQGRRVIFLGECFTNQSGAEQRVQKNKDFLNQLEEKLREQYGYDVRRIPLLITEAGLYSYNNVIVSVTNSTRNVWIPRYSYQNGEAFFKENEILVEQAWNVLNFTVFWIDAPFNDLLRTRASLRCITNEFKK